MARVHTKSSAAGWDVRVASSWSRRAIVAGAFAAGLATAHGATAQPRAPLEESAPVTETTPAAEAHVAAAAEAVIPAATPRSRALTIDTINPYAATPPSLTPIVRIDTRNPYVAQGAPGAGRALDEAVISPALVLRAPAIDTATPYVTSGASPTPAARPALDTAPTPAIDTNNPYSRRSGARRDRVVTRGATVEGAETVS
jgi:hypothetical protein